jgi:hypothetical protein
MEDIKMNLKLVGSRSVDWNNLAQEREKGQAVVKMAMVCGFNKCGEIHWLPKKSLLHGFS